MEASEALLVGQPLNDFSSESAPCLFLPFCFDGATLLCRPKTLSVT
jgi:hypothetical protein